MYANGNYQIVRYCGEAAMAQKVGSVRLFGLAVAIAIGPVMTAWAHGITERVSLGPGGVQSDNSTIDMPAISADGRFVVFSSFATNLVSDDTNFQGDVFVRDRLTGTTQRVSVGPHGVQGNNESAVSAISADGRFIAFDSGATNLVPGDTNEWGDVFVRDRQRGTNKRVSVGPGGVQSNSFSGFPAISANGRFVTFFSSATNLVPGDTNNMYDVFVHDHQTDTTRRVSLGAGGVQGNGSSYASAISAEGRFVAFESDATNLVSGDTNGSPDIFIRDRQTGTTRRVNLGPGGVQGNAGSTEPAISADGRFVVFTSFATNLVLGDTNGVKDVFIRDRQTGRTERVSVGPGGVQGNGESRSPAISADGHFVAFDSWATNLVTGDSNDRLHVFIWDRKTGKTRRVSVGAGGVQGDSLSLYPAISANGRFVTFSSDASNLVPGDTNGLEDVFVRMLAP